MFEKTAQNAKKLKSKAASVHSHATTRIMLLSARQGTELLCPDSEENCKGLCKFYCARGVMTDVWSGALRRRSERK